MICSTRHRELLSGTQRLLKRTCLYYALPPGQPSPDMIEVLQQVPPRHRQATAGDVQTEFSLFVFTRRGGFYRKKTVNAQVSGERAGREGGTIVDYSTQLSEILR